MASWARIKKKEINNTLSALLLYFFIGNYFSSDWRTNYVSSQIVIMYARFNHR